VSLEIRNVHKTSKIWEQTRAFYCRQIDLSSRVLERSHDPAVRLEALRRLYRIYISLHRLQILQQLGDLILSMAELELDINHSYCSSLQDLRRGLQRLTDARHDPAEALVRQREEVARLQARRNAIIALIMRR
jgi:hypothetical protein